MKSVQCLFRWIDTCANYVAAIALLVTFGMTFLNVVMRYIFGGGFSWSEEGARYGLVLLIILGVIETSHHREHFGLDLISGHLIGGWSRLIRIIQDILVLLVSVVMCIGSYNMTILNLYNTTPAMKIPSWLPYSCLMISAGVSVVHSVFYLILDIGIAKLSEDEKEGAQ